MNFFEKTKIMIYGVEHTCHKNKDVTYYTVNYKGIEVQHREDGKPTLITSRGKEEYYIKGKHVSESQAKEYAEKQHIQFVRENVKEF